MPSFGRRRVRVRPMSATDGDALLTVFDGLSPASRRARFLAPVDRLTASMQRSLTAVDGSQHVGLVAEVRQGRERRPIGLARYVVSPDGSAEVAYEVVDEWQGHGVGSQLVRELVATARRHGVERLHASILRENAASLAVLRAALPQLRIREDGGQLEASAWLVEPPLQVADLVEDLTAA
jgi:RimJ/RimL family protein N-acetyltransferase